MVAYVQGLDTIDQTPAASTSAVAASPWAAATLFRPGDDSVGSSRSGTPPNVIVGGAGATAAATAGGKGKGGTGGTGGTKRSAADAASEYEASIALMAQARGSPHRGGEALPTLAAATITPYIPADSFNGRKDDYTFKIGDFGLGYYHCRYSDLPSSEYRTTVGSVVEIYRCLTCHGYFTDPAEYTEHCFAMHTNEPYLKKHMGNSMSGG